MTRARAAALLRLFRVDLSVSAGVCVILGMLVAVDSVPAVSTMVMGFLSYFFISATALILNDYFDFETDRVNAPDRPLPSGLVTRPQVLALSIFAALLGLVLALLISASAFVLAFFVWLLGILYNWRLKRAGLPGNLLVSVSVASTFIFGGVAVGNPSSPLVWWFAVLVLLFNLAEEIAADAFDIQGDLRAGSRSIAILFGQHNALRTSAGLFRLAILVSILPFVLGWLEWFYLVPIAVMDGVIVYSTHQLLKQKTDERRRYVRVIYLTGLASLVGIILIRMAVV